LRRLVVLSILLIFSGLVLLLPSSSLVSQLSTSSSASGSTTTTAGGFAVSRSLGATAGTTTTGTVESMLAFGLIGVGLVLEVLSLFTDVGGVPVPGGSSPSAAEKEGANRP
jgi:hypothetical protein